MSSLVDYAKQGTVGVITVNNPPVNALSTGVPQGIIESIEKGAADPSVKAFILRGGGTTFIAGADIREFGKPKPPGVPTLQELLPVLEGYPKPVIAAIHGTALGGGLEVALACHFRCAVPQAKLGLPEVKLGLLPGGGGTQRLPRLIGVEPALDLILSGEHMSAAKALELGVIDEILGGDLLSSALEFAERVVGENRPLRVISRMTATLKGASGPDYFNGVRKSLEKKARGHLAPFLIVDCVEAAVNLPFAEGRLKERELFMQCVESRQSKALRHVFFAEREAGKIPDVPKETPTKPIRTAGVVGAGTMGGGIAMNFANAGIPVRLIERSQELLDRGLGTIRKNYANTVQKGGLTQAEMDRRMGLISGSVSFDALSDVDVVVEAAFEEMGVKKEIFQILDRVCPPSAILATNTSTLDVNEIAAVTRRPESVIGLHFFSPANVMRLLEVVRGAKSSKETVATSMKLAKSLNKLGVLVGVCDGFVGNRMVAKYTREAHFLLEEGALPQQVDRVLYDFGMAMGPFAMGDLAGLDIGWAIRKRRATTRPKDERYSTVADQICELGRFGQKTGAGFYRYEEGSRTPIPDPVVEEIIVRTSEKMGIKRREISDQEIIERCIYQLVNEGAKILEEGMALRASDIDLIYINGYGFPAHRGGPMFHAETVGLANVYEAMCRYAEIHGDYWRPAPLLKRLVEQGKGLGDL
ncbi:3-hydroxyacyl-CoA dehydrogenase NAD-binding domain-containing protein [Geobacter sp.]|uniref:3-hydroxyacyl-CoA dehydrogenase NAD-binding domain-containing protein n=1 Tax=Geobacter sp. TaxID=46610 RepID=UPI00263767FA|nr:3-hydroxyacyl-CoA dehydrogenase NAD-binding domain-containing protein [Geobacter sp.]